MVPTAEGEAQAKKMRAAFIESSAKQNENVGESGVLLWRLPVDADLPRQGVRGAAAGDAEGVQPCAGTKEVVVVGLGQIIAPLGHARTVARSRASSSNRASFRSSLRVPFVTTSTLSAPPSALRPLTPGAQTIYTPTSTTINKSSGRHRLHHLALWLRISSTGLYRQSRPHSGHSSSVGPHCTCIMAWYRWTRARGV